MPLATPQGPVQGSPHARPEAGTQPRPSALQPTGPPAACRGHGPRTPSPCSLAHPARPPPTPPCDDRRGGCPNCHSCLQSPPCRLEQGRLERAAHQPHTLRPGGPARDAHQGSVSSRGKPALKATRPRTVPQRAGAQGATREVGAAAAACGQHRGGRGGAPGSREPTPGAAEVWLQDTGQGGAGSQKRRRWESRQPPPCSGLRLLRSPRTVEAALGPAPPSRPDPRSGAQQAANQGCSRPCGTCHGWADAAPAQAPGASLRVATRCWPGPRSRPPCRRRGWREQGRRGASCPCRRVPPPPRHGPAASGPAWAAPLPGWPLAPGLLCRPGWSCWSDRGPEHSALCPQRPAWAQLSLLAGGCRRQVWARGPRSEPRALQRTRPGSDPGAACGQSGLEAGSPIRKRSPLRAQGPGLGAVPIGPAFQEVGEHLALALDADLAAAQEAVGTLPQQPVHLLRHLREKSLSRPATAGACDPPGVTVKRT